MQTNYSVRTSYLLKCLGDRHHQVYRYYQPHVLNKPDDAIKHGLDLLNNIVRSASN